MNDASASAPTRRRRRILGLDEQQRQTERRRLLLDAALELFGTRGYAATSIERLCQTAGIGTNSFYELYPNKEAVMVGLYGQVTARFRQAVEVSRSPIETIPTPSAPSSTRSSTKLCRRPPRRPCRLHRGRGHQRERRGAAAPYPQRLRRRPPGHRWRHPPGALRLGDRAAARRSRAEPAPQHGGGGGRHRRDDGRLAARPRPRSHRTSHRRHRPSLPAGDPGHHPGSRARQLRRSRVQRRLPVRSGGYEGPEPVVPSRPGSHMVGAGLAPAERHRRHPGCGRADRPSPAATALKRPAEGDSRYMVASASHHDGNTNAASAAATSDTLPRSSMEHVADS